MRWSRPRWNLPDQPLVPRYLGLFWMYNALSLSTSLGSHLPLRLEGSVRCLGGSLSATSTSSKLTHTFRTGTSLSTHQQSTVGYLTSFGPSAHKSSKHMAPRSVTARVSSCWLTSCGPYRLCSCSTVEVIGRNSLNPPSTPITS